MIIFFHRELYRQNANRQNSFGVVPRPLRVALLLIVLEIRMDRVIQSGNGLSFPDKTPASDYTIAKKFLSTAARAGR